MSLSNLIRRRPSGGVATATVAIPATSHPGTAQALARIAGIAVANPTGEVIAGPLQAPVANDDNEAFERRVAESQARARLGAAAYAAAPPDFEERAALIEYGAGVPRHWAEPFARLNCMACPAAFTSKQWAVIINDGGLFLDRWGTEAEGLGWTAEEVFGVGRDAPEARHDLKGLVVLINGWEVIAVDASKATVKNPKTGSTQSIYRKADAGGRCLLWELKP